MRTVVVTGAQGYVGRHVVSQLLNEPVRILGIGRSPPLVSFTHQVGVLGEDTAALAPLPRGLSLGSDARYTYRSVDLTDPTATEAVIAAHKPDLVIHLAGALRDETWRALVDANLTATTVLIEALGRLKDPPRLIFGSSGSVYGAQGALPTAEDALPDPVGLYAASKLMGEIAAGALCGRFGVRLTVARLFNLVGPGLQPRHLLGRLVHEIAAMERRGLPGRLVTGPLGATRDLVDVRDAARMLVTLAAETRAPQVINIASGIEISIREVVQGLVARALTPIALEETQAAAPPGADRQAADTRRADALGLQARIPLDQSLDDMLDYARGLTDAQGS